MKKLLLANILVVVLVVAMTATATWAWFSAQDTTQQAEITTAKLGINAVSGFPLAFTNMLPGDSITKTIQIQNSGTAAEDFYVQMIPESPAGDTNFCYKKVSGAWVFDPKVKIKIQEGSTVLYDNWICYLYPVNNGGEGGKVIAKLTDNAAAGSVHTFTVTLTLDPSAGNVFQDKNNKDTLNLIAVQYNGPAPAVSYGSVWPAGDANYGN